MKKINTYSITHIDGTLLGRHLPCRKVVQLIGIDQNKVLCAAKKHLCVGGKYYIEIDGEMTSQGEEAWKAKFRADWEQAASSFDKAEWVRKWEPGTKRLHAVSGDRRDGNAD